MTISTHYIHSVLKRYQKQLKLAELIRDKKSTPQFKKDDVTISAKAKWRQIYQQAVSNVVHKLTKNDLSSAVFFK